MRPFLKMVAAMACVLSLVAAAPFAKEAAEKPAVKPGQTVANSVGIKLAYVPVGSFLMGSPDGEKGRQEEERQHQVTLSRPFRIGAMEVTQAQWKAVMGAPRGHFKGADRPVDQVSWKDAIAFCKKLSEKEKQTYRLPTEAEWEYACRAGLKSAYSPDLPPEKVGWFMDNSGDETHPVGQKQPNAWGLFDMHGNVAEWCHDFYAPEYPDRAVTDPAGPQEGKPHVVRGGAWSHFPRGGRCAARSNAPSSHQFKHVGFRVVLEPPK